MAGEEERDPDATILSGSDDPGPTRVDTGEAPLEPGPEADADATRVMPPSGGEAPGDAAETLLGADVPDASDPEDPGPTRVETPPAADTGADPSPDSNATVYGEGEDAEDSTNVRADQLAPGTVLFGEYEIQDVLGAGGMGEVYRARHRALDETRAIKVMHPKVADDPTAMEFFLREAKALLSVRHPAVVRCHDLLSDAEGRVYLVMEMIDGIALSDRLRNGALAEGEVRTLGARVASGLAAAHAGGVIHRDLSPDNIVLPGGRPEEAKLIDFGIAKVLATGQETILDGFKGKLPYASPEQLGFFGGKIDGRSDLYSLGLVLYAAGTGARMDMGNTLVDAVDSRRNLAGLPDDCPASLRADLEQLLALNPENRPRSADGLFADESAPVPGPGGVRIPRALLAGLAASLLAVALYAFTPEGWLQREPAPLVAPPPEPIPTEPAPPVAPAPAPTPAPTPDPTPLAPPSPRPRPPGGQAMDLRQRLRIVGLLRGAEAAFARGDLVGPPGENALEKYRVVLEQSPGNADAKAGIARVSARLVELADDATTSGSYDLAESLLADAARVSPRHRDIAPARERLRAARGS